ncbi:MAG: YicC family protein [Nitrospira sp.]|nr:YicC family protein [Nitrospira sp.]MDH4250779.1 YicC family protein [Nitrospira sp.]MDH4342797.1 YicC family protein [Nitrospira sp.]MDH5336073.1 YicC family protein [Nitrospira sp.]
MIKSMTGFGRRQGLWSDGTVSVEVRSVNHRFLETSIRLPKSMSGLEERFKKMIQQQCVRGRVDLAVLLQGSRGSTREVQLDLGLAKQYHQALRTLQRTLKLKGSIDIGLMAGFRDIVALSEQTTDDPKLTKMVEKLGLLAVSDMVKMREKEGALLSQDILARLDHVRECKSSVSSRAPFIAQETFDRMKQRVEKLLADAIPDLPRLNQELAQYADRCDITEELVRLDTHMIQFERAIQGTESVGKTLDFLLQELGREVNTIGSKSNDAAIRADVVQMKAELERIREQIQNVE